jgi:hypothetical protein
LKEPNDKRQRSKSCNSTDDPPALVTEMCHTTGSLKGTGSPQILVSAEGQSLKRAQTISARYMSAAVAIGLANRARGFEGSERQCHDRRPGQKR